MSGKEEMRFKKQGNQEGEEKMVRKSNDKARDKCKKRVEFNLIGRKAEHDNNHVQIKQNPEICSFVFLHPTENAYHLCGGR